MRAKNDALRAGSLCDVHEWFCLVRLKDRFIGLIS